MRRIELFSYWRLVIAVSVCGALAVVIGVRLTGSPTQLARQLRERWRIGELTLRPEQAHRLDSRSIELPEVTIDGSHDELGVGMVRVDAERVHWQGAHRWEWRTQADWRAQSFRVGEARVTWRVPSSVPTSHDWSWSDLPGLIECESATVSLEGVEPTGLGLLELRELRIDRDRERATIRAKLFDSARTWGEARWLYDVNLAGDSDGTSRLRLDGVSCERFAFGPWASRLGFGWPRFLDSARGSVDLEWTRDASRRDRWEIQHCQLELPVVGLSRRLERVAGRLELGDRVDPSWRVETAYFSESRLRGEFSIEGAADEGRLSGRVVSEGLLIDRGAWSEFPTIWQSLFASRVVAGEGDVEFEIGGTPSGEWRDLLVSTRCEGRFDLPWPPDATFDGRLALTYGADETVLTGEITQDSGSSFGLEGRVTERELNVAFQRESDAVGELRFWLDGAELRASGRGSPRPISELDSRWTAGSWWIEGFDARWTEARGWTWELDIVWQGVELAPTFPWPVERPRHAIDGRVTVVRDSRHKILLQGSCHDRRRRWDVSGEYLPRSGLTLEGQMYPSITGSFRPGGLNWSVAPGVPFGIRGFGLRWEVR